MGGTNVPSVGGGPTGGTRSGGADLPGWEHLRAVAEAARDGSYGPDGKRFGAATVLALLDENEQLRAEVKRLVGAVEWASRIFISLGKDMGTFDPQFEKDKDEQDLLIWLGAFAPSPSGSDDKDALADG